MKDIVIKLTSSRFLSGFFPQSITFPHDVWFRILSTLKRRKVTKYTIGIYAYFRERHFAYKYGIHINSNISVGKGLLIVHGGYIPKYFFNW